jgi:hypothetical protein
MSLFLALPKTNTAHIATVCAKQAWVALHAARTEGIPMCEDSTPRHLQARLPASLDMTACLPTGQPAGTSTTLIGMPIHACAHLLNMAGRP